MTDIKDLIQPDRGQDAIAIHLVNKDGFEDFAKSLSAGQRAQLSAQKFTGGVFQYAIVADGDSFFVVSGTGNPESLKLPGPESSFFLQIWCFSSSMESVLLA